jgi:serine/threonine protein kinase
MSAANTHLAAPVLPDRYEILDELVLAERKRIWVAQDTELEIPVVFKQLDPRLEFDPHMVALFYQEGKLGQQFTHPYIVKTLEAVDYYDQLLIKMEYVEGVSLHQMINPELGLTVVRRYGIMLAEALSAIHGEGVVHCDVKPGNLIATGSKTSRLMLCDFGIAQPFGINPHRPYGGILATASFCSPEQVNDKPLDGRSDIYNFGLVMYEMLTGHRAFDGVGVSAVMLRQVKDDPEPLTKCGRPIPQELSDLTMRCLRKDPAERFQSAVELKQALEGVTL